VTRDDVNNNNNNRANHNQDHIHDLVRESTVKALNNEAKYTKRSKHKVLVMGDSHSRGCAAKILASLDTRFDVCGVMKPGLNTESLTETAKGEVGKLTMNDFLIIWSGTNDMERNHPQNAFKNITNSVQSVNHTSIIYISVPYRHDVTNDSHITVRLKPLIVNYSNLQKFSAMSI
jgi:trans-2-enoyl-CoA reductase